MVPDPSVEERLADLVPALDATSVSIGPGEVQAYAARGGGARRGATSRWQVALVGAVVLSLLATVGVVLADDTSTRRVDASGSSRDAVFTKRAGDVLLFTDDLGGRTLVDLDHRIAVRRVLPGRDVQEGPSPVPVRVADALLVLGEQHPVGINSILAMPLDDGEPLSLGTSLRALAATERGRVWLIDEGLPSRVRQVDFGGQVFVDTQGLEGSVRAVIAVPGGLIYQQATGGMVIWDASTGATELLDADAFGISDVRKRTIAWQSGLRAIHFTTIGGSEHTVRSPTDSLMIFGRGRFSPDGRWFATTVADLEPGANTTTNGRVAVIDMRDRTIRSIICRDSESSKLEVGWSADSQRVYCATKSNANTHTTITQYELRSDHEQATTLAFGGTFGFVVVSEREAKPLLNAPLVKGEVCSSPSSVDTGQPESCAFRV